MSGSLGDAPASFFQFKAQSGVQYIATAIRGLARDAVLMVKVKNGLVEFETKSFTNQEVLSLEEYDVDFWKSRVGKTPLNYRLLPLYFKLLITHWYYWSGFGTMLVLSLLISLRKTKKKNKFAKIIMKKPFIIFVIN